MSSPEAAAAAAGPSLPPSSSTPHRHPVLALYSLPLPLGRRLRPTCLAVSPALLVLGTASGSLHFYSRPWTLPLPSLSSLVSPPLQSPLASRALPLPPPSFLRLVPLDLPPSSSPSLTHLQLSAHHPHLVAVTTASSLQLLYCNPLTPSLAHRLLHSLPLSSPPTSLCFSPEDATKRCVLYVGDEGGVVHRLSLPLPPSLLQRVSAEPLLRLEPPIVQVTALASHLLVSSTARSYVCAHSASKAEVKAIPIGSKPRAAAHTVCVDPSAPATAAGPALLASRPGRRLWKADCTGTVLSTLILQPPLPSSFTPLTSLSPLPLPSTVSLASLAFSHLLPFAGAVVAYTPHCPHLVVVDVGHVAVVDWFVCFARLLSVQAEGRALFVLHEREEGAEAELSIVGAMSPYSHLQRLLEEAEAQSLSVDALLLTAVKYRVYDRGLLTRLQRLVDARRASKGLTGAEEGEAAEATVAAFDRLVVEAERSERTSKREDYWDDDEALPMAGDAAVPASTAPALATVADDGSAAPLASLLSSTARRALSRLTQPSLVFKEREREREEAEATALPASPKPSLLERTSAIFAAAQAASPAAPSPPSAPSAAATPPTPRQPLPTISRAAEAEWRQRR